jgi:hypothetical protein
MKSKLTSRKRKKAKNRGLLYRREMSLSYSRTNAQAAVINHGLIRKVTEATIQQFTLTLKIRLPIRQHYDSLFSIKQMQSLP